MSQNKTFVLSSFCHCFWNGEDEDGDDESPIVEDDHTQEVSVQQYVADGKLETKFDQEITRGAEPVQKPKKSKLSVEPAEESNKEMMLNVF